MLRDVRPSHEFRSVEAHYNSLFEPGTGHVYSASELATDPDGRRIFLSGLRFAGSLEEGPSSGIFELVCGKLVQRSRASGKLPRLSHRDRLLAFVEPQATGDTIVLEQADGSFRPVHTFDGHIEVLEWSRDDAGLLLVVAGLGADLSGHEGGFATAHAQVGPDWLPHVETGREDNLWRRLWIYEVEVGHARILSAANTNVWEASWCGSASIAAVCSTNHDEGSWYRSNLVAIDLSGRERRIYTPADQIGLPSGSPDGKKIAFVEAFCSDRGVVCGTLKLAHIDGAVQTLCTNDTEVTNLSWRDDMRIHYAGHRAFETVVGDVNAADGRLREIWSSQTLTAGEWYPKSWPVSQDQCMLVTEAYDQAPHIARATNGRIELLHSFASAGACEASSRCGSIEPVRWNAPDGLEIHGWLVRPQDAKPPYRLMVDIHGGPVWASRNRWMGRLRATSLLAQRGCAVLYPNPRGSSTRGQDFARRVLGDMGGADGEDILAACRELASRDVVDRKAIALTGTSYGGFMSCWLVTRDPNFAAAMPISPVTNWYSQHRTSQIGFFDEMFLCAGASEPGGKFFERSPVMFTSRVRTPTLVMAGALDKNTPPSQALEFYRSLLEAGTETALVTYPRDGHSLRGYPAYIDTAARIVQWFDAHVPQMR